MNKRALGNDKEDFAVRFLNANGVEVLDRNFYTRHGELDIVGTDGDYLVFFEVKYRKSNSFGNPMEAITMNKQRNIIKSAKIYLYLKHYPETTYIRFDAIGICDDKVEWIKDAFQF